MVVKVINKLNWLTPNQIGRVLNIHPCTIRKFIKRGNIDAYMLPNGGFLITRENFEKFKQYYNSTKKYYQ